MDKLNVAQVKNLLHARPSSLYKKFVTLQHASEAVVDAEHAVKNLLNFLKTEV